MSVQVFSNVYNFSADTLQEFKNKLVGIEDASDYGQEQYLIAQSYRTLKVVGKFNDNNLSLSGMLSNLSNLETIDFSKFDTSNVTSMQALFTSFSNLTSLDISNLNTSNVTDMSNMFTGNRISSLDLSNFDTSNCENFDSMFMGCTNLGTIYASESFVIKENASASNMFIACMNLPNFNSSITDGSKANYGSGGYFTYKAKVQYSIQLFHEGKNAYPKVAVDGTTIVDNNGVISATAQTPSIATTSVAGIVKPDGTTINVSADGTISASSTANVEAIKESEFTQTYKNNMQSGSIAIVVKNI